MPLTIHQFACLSDNYGFLIRDEASGKTACIDTPDAGAILRELDDLGWELDMILNTHWHPDHAGGNADIKAMTGCTIVGPPEVTRIAPLDREVAGGDSPASLGANLGPRLDPITPPQSAAHAASVECPRARGCVRARRRGRPS